MSFSNYLEDKVLKHVFTNTAYTPPAAVYVALFTAAPSDTGGGTEVSGGSYARQSAAFSVTGNNPTEAANSSGVEFPTATANWGTITHIGVYDAATSGNLLAYSLLTDPADFLTPLAKTISTGDIFRINASNLKIRLD